MSAREILQRIYHFRSISVLSVPTDILAVWALIERAWPLLLVLTVLPLVVTALWDRLLRWLGVSRRERQRLAIDAARRYLNLRDPP